MHIDERWQEEIKKIDRGLFIDYHGEFGMLQVKHKDDRTGLIRTVCFVKDEDGNPCELNLSHIRYLKNSVEWDRVAEFPDPDKLYASIIKDIKEAETKRDLERRGFQLDFNREHKKEWKSAMESFQQSMPAWQYKLMMKKAAMQKEQNKKISVGFTGELK